jgi:hypothetical protein
MKLDQHHADMYTMLQMQSRLIAALQEAFDYGISDDWINRTALLIEVAKSDWLEQIERSCPDLPLADICERLCDGGLFALLDLMLRRETVDA